jgi:hypothetical protein
MFQEQFIYLSYLFDVMYVLWHVVSECGASLRISRAVCKTGIFAAHCDQVVKLGYETMCTKHDFSVINHSAHSVLKSLSLCLPAFLYAATQHFSLPLTLYKILTKEIFHA